jgi:type II secretory pathway pseudopilin PulG
MTAPRRRAILVGLMLALLAAAAAWNTHWMLAQRDGAQQASDDLAACRELTAAILSQRDRPAVASAEAMGVQELGKRIEAAFGKAQIAPSSLGGVDPQAAHRVGDSPYLRKPTALSLRGVSPRQVATFLYCLTDESGLSVRDLRLSTPHGGGAGGVWDAEATLTYLIYSPAKTRRDH